MTATLPSLNALWGWSISDEKEKNHPENDDEKQVMKENNYVKSRIKQWLYFYPSV